MQRLEAKESWFGWGEDVRDDVVRQGEGRGRGKGKKRRAGPRGSAETRCCTPWHPKLVRWPLAGYQLSAAACPVSHVPMARLATALALL